MEREIQWRYQLAFPSARVLRAIRQRAYCENVSDLFLFYIIALPSCCTDLLTHKKFTPLLNLSKIHPIAPRCFPIKVWCIRWSNKWWMRAGSLGMKPPTVLVVHAFYLMSANSNGPFYSWKCSRLNLHNSMYTLTRVHWECLWPFGHPDKWCSID